MEEDKKNRERPSIVVNGAYYDIHDNTFLGGTQVFGESAKGKKEEDKPLNLEPASVREAINLLMKGNTKENKRWWFAPYVVLRDYRVVNNLKAFEAYINEMYNGCLPVPIDTHDLSKEIEVQCFAKPFKDWTPEKAPVTSNTYQNYTKLVETFIGLLPKM